MTIYTSFTALPDIHVGDLELLPERVVVRWKGRRVQLNGGKLFVILAALARRPGFVLTRDALLDALNDHGEIADRNIDTGIKLLRQAFKAVDPEFAQIETVYGFGYRWDDEQ